MSNFFKQMNTRTMLLLNVVSLFITAVCEAFAIYIFLTKGRQSSLLHWKYVAIVVGVVVISLLFLGAIASMVFFVIEKRRKGSQ